MNHYITLILITLSGIFNACMDVLKDHYPISWFKLLKHEQFWDPDLSWTNKYKWNDELKCWSEEKFWGSSTIFVMFTDAWHLFKTLTIFFCILAIVSMPDNKDWYYDFIVFYVVFTTLFEISYRQLSKGEK